MKEKVPVITAEDVAKGDATATAKAMKQFPTTAEAEAEDTAAEAGPKPHKHYYRKDGTCACGQVRKVRKPR